MELSEYMRELNKIELLKPQEEKNLWIRYKENDDTAARTRIIEAYQPLVFKQAQPFKDHTNIMDIIQEGTVGLIEAVESYDHTRGVAFSLFAVHRIKGRMLSFLRKEGSVDVACLDDFGSESRTHAELLMDSGASVIERVENREAVGRLMEAVDRLPERERQVLSQLYIESQEAKDVAQALNVSTSHIYRLQKSGIRRARGMLSRFMQYWK